MSKMHWLLAAHVRRQSSTSSSPLVSTIVVIPVPSLFSPSSSSSVVEIVGVNGPGLHLGESHRRLHVVVEVRHGGHGVHGSSHGRRRHRLRLLDVGLLESVVVCRDMREDKGPLHGSAHLLLLVRLLRESLVAVAATDGVTGVAASPSSLLLVLHVPSKHPLTGGDQGKPRGLELGGEERGEDGRRARVVGREAVVGLSHVLLRARNGVKRLQSVSCSPQQNIL